MPGLRSSGFDHHQQVSIENQRPSGNNSMLSEMADAIDNDYKPLCITHITLSQSKLKKKKASESPY
jgi:hypothetical protein